MNVRRTQLVLRCGGTAAVLYAAVPTLTFDVAAGLGASIAERLRGRATDPFAIEYGAAGMAWPAFFGTGQAEPSEWKSSSRLAVA
jgi:hypothetical protein